MAGFLTQTTRIGTHILVSTLALAAANVANAQSYDAGDPVVVSGSVTFDRAGTPNTETYTINSNTAVLDFIPNDIGPGGPINFQLAGTLAQYLGGLGITDFTVLNRILAADPTRAIQLNGTIISRLQASPTTPGGSVWFYSPGGIIVGSTAVIDVGNLLLATGDPTGGSGVISNTNQFTINSVPDSNAAINIQAGAQITASNAGSYIALVAPAIRQSGTVSTNGSAAYVAAEQTTLTFNSGLFNIQTTVGSNANNNTPLIHDGTTRFIDDTGQRRAYVVSVAKNDAITMLIEGSGQLGFDTATGVNIDNGVVVLSGGYDVADTTYANLAGTAGVLRHDIQITSPANNAHFQGQVNPFATSEIRINSLGQSVAFAGDVSMNAGSLASIVSGPGGSVDIAGDLDLSTLVYGFRDAEIFGGTVVLDASLGNISVGGNTALTSFVDADFLGGADAAGTVNGGAIVIIADNGNAVNLLGNLDMLVEANGADQLLASQTSAGDAIGGNIILASSGGSTISVGGAANMVSTALGGTVQLGDATAGNATGGNINLLADDGNIAFGNNLSVATTATGGQVNASGTTAAGNGTGGQINFSVGSGSMSVVGGLVADVSGFGGSTQFATSRSGGDGIGGAIGLSLLGTGNIDIGNDILFRSNGQGTSAVGVGNVGGSASGGIISINIVNGAFNGLGQATLLANAIGGLGSGGGTGGFISVSAQTGSTLDIAGPATLDATGTGGSGLGTTGNGGSGIGGDIQVLAQGGTMNFGGNVSLSAFGRGESGADNSDVVAQGGFLDLQADGGAISIAGNLDMFAQGLGQAAGTGQDGANAIGGSSIASAINGGTVDVLGIAVVSATAVGGDSNGGINGNAGDGQGGNAQFVATGNGILTIGQGATASALGIGGNGLTAGSDGGNGFGGTASFSQDTGGLVQISVPAGQSAVITTDGIGGTSTGGGGIGGSGTGGDSRFVSNDGTIILNGALFVSAQGQGGASDGIAGGNGTGGIANIGTDAGLTRVTGNTTIRSAGLGGAGLGTGTDGGFGLGGLSLIGTIGTGVIDLQGSVTFNDNSSGGSAVSGVGGSGSAGLSQIFASAGTVDIGGFVNFNTNGFGGNGSTGGIGNGGRASIFADSAGTINFANQINMTARGRGGQSNGPGTTGGLGQGGMAEVFAHGTINIVGDYSANSGGIGGSGANGANGGDGFGGVGSIVADGGAIRFDGGARTRGTTNGGSIISGNGSGGDAQAGLAEMIARNGGNIEIFGVSGLSDANVSATALSGGGLFGSSSSGNAIGGTANVFAESGGTITIAGGLLVTASGLAPDFFDPSSQYADLGGNGTGGTVNILANGGNIIGTSSVAALANGHGGLGVVTGGTGTGGTVNVQAIDGLLDFSSGADEIFLSMSGFGGNAVNETDGAGNILRGGGNGGDGIGGTILLLAGLFGDADGLTGILRMGDLRISENAGTPLGLSGFGGAGAAGAAGQDGGDGGGAVAGVVRIGTNNGSSQFTAGNITVGNRAIGGIGGDGENGGDGGDAAGRQTAIGTFNETGANTGGFMTVGNIDINGSALGGNGGAGLNGTGGIGGDSLVGPSALLTSQASAYLLARPNIFTFGDALLTMDSTGGDGGIGTAVRAAGGTAAGFGTAIIVSQATDGVGFGQAVGNSFVGRAVSTGGLGSGDVRAASNRGFSVLSAFGGSITLANATLIDGGLSAHQNGIVSTIESGNGFVLVTGMAEVDVDGDFGLLGYAGGDVELENLNVVAGGTLLFDDPNDPGSTIAEAITVNQNAVAVLGGDFTIGEDIIIGGIFDLTAGGSINTLGITAGAGITLRSGGTITTGNLLSIGNIAVTGTSNAITGIPASIVTGNITSQSGLINVASDIGDITLGDLTSPNAITINAGNGSTSSSAGGDISIGAVQGSEISIFGTNNLTTGAITATGSLALNLVGTITSGNIATGAGASLISQNGSINTGDIQADSDLFVHTNGAIQTGNITTGGDARLASGDINTLAGGSSISVGNVVSQGQSDIRGLGQIQTGNISAASLNMFSRTGIATGDLSVSNGLISLGTTPDTGGPNANITTGSVQNANGSIFIRANQGAVQTNGLMSGNALEITGSESVTVSGAINAIQSANITTNGLASFGGLVDSPLITVTSGDINFGTNGGLGSTNTNNLEINAAAPGQPIIFGGDGSGGGYNLSAAEATRLRSRTISFNALQLSGAAPADITIRDFTMQGSLAGSSANLLASDLFINSPGNIRVSGAIRIENAGVEDGLFLSAESGRIEVVTDMGGSITIVDGAGGLDGNLYLDARHIAVGTADLLGRLAEDPRFAGRDAEVNAPDGSNRPEGYISANYIQADGFDTIIIQNSGTDALRGGFSAGSGGFVLDSENDAAGSVDAVINGRVANSSGEFLTGADTLNGIAFETPADAELFSAGSTVNGCLLNGGGCPTAAPPSVSHENPDTIASDVREIINEQSEEASEEEEERAAELTPSATGKKSPIAPNIPVVNTSRLNPSPIVTDPITGSGNPNLTGGELEIDPDPSPTSDDGDS